ncbi:Ribokinase-like protein, partial [Fomitiporia mediterranea MF3/22]|uniref:Ribokinase-like protein n=1 Tax=Fomitiporia mediterranea (strain MF3/22) TaxID=694068 RepID=UPI0004407DF6
KIGGGGTYASIGARIWLPPDKIGMIIDRGGDFPPEVQSKLDAFGKDMWLYRDDSERVTTRAVNIYRGDSRGFNYITPRRRLTPSDLRDTHLDQPATLHFICSPTRAHAIISEVLAVPSWKPVTIYEPIPDRCVPEELPALLIVLPHIDILSPNSEEALSILSMQQPPTKENIEEACDRFLRFGVGPDGNGCVIIRSGALGAYAASREHPGRWIDAYWSKANSERVVDVTGAGNSFLGGLSAGLLLSGGDVFEAIFHASISASFTVEQLGLPKLTHNTDGTELWNGDGPFRRLEVLRSRRLQ